MQYISTRGGDESYSAAEAIRLGIARNGGLLVPEAFPKLELAEISDLKELDYIDRAVAILSLYLTDYTREELAEACLAAYGDDKFLPRPAAVCQLNPYNEREFMLQLEHGPTSAFKDYALQLLPHLMTAAIRKSGDDSTLCILTATSGDTGKAALEGFHDVPSTCVLVYYPGQGVSPVQEKQMVTQVGENVSVIAIDGNFDDAQTAVKTCFLDETLAETLRRHQVVLSSANSINWGRLVPQIVYYFSAYADLLAEEKIELGEAINIVVPTGNFGNILAAYYARRMGLPVNKLICASNRNKVLADFIRTGRYHLNRKFMRTNSPSMDILISSNLERLLYELSGRKGEQVSNWMNELKEKGEYKLLEEDLELLQGVFVGGHVDESQTIQTIRDVYDRTDHVIDTHTAVGVNLYQRYFNRTSDPSKTLFVATASPFKFAESVADALFGQGYARGRSEAVLLQEISAESGLEIPAGLANLDERPVLHSKTCGKTEVRQTILDYFQIDE